MSSRLTIEQRLAIEARLKFRSDITRTMTLQLLAEIDRLTGASFLCSGRLLKVHPCECYCHSQIGSTPSGDVRPARKLVTR